MGAAGMVTGSRTLLSVGKKSYLIDCGLFQGQKADRELNWQPLPVPIESIDGILLTHAHLDHSGLAPRLAKMGYHGPIHVSKGTADLCEVMWLDAAHLEEEFADYANRSGYSNHKPALPLFDTQDAEKALALLVPHHRAHWINLDDRVSFQFLRSGHIVGSSFVQFRIVEKNGVTRVVTFSGDIGHGRSQIFAPPEAIGATDVLILESTYGDRLHPRGSVVDDFAAAVKSVLQRRGVLVIPAFAVGRSQEVLRVIRLAENRGLIPKVPVILDSPMSEKATSIFVAHPDEHSEDCIVNVDGRALGEQDCLPNHFEISRTVDDSMLACMREGPLIVISAAGMLSGGRILHHLKHRLPDQRNMVLFVGFQAAGSKGRFLQEKGAVEGVIRIHHSEVPVRADIVTLDHMSAHGDYRDITVWMTANGSLPQVVLLNHGEPAALAGMLEHVQSLSKEMKVLAADRPKEFEFFVNGDPVRVL